MGKEINFVAIAILKPDGTYPPRLGSWSFDHNNIQFFQSFIFLIHIFNFNLKKTIARS